ncbi:hypothetical protein TDMWS_17350 [Thermodesulfomicrobium sp. WS]|uniref:hypothetical protein n=1 Tax=Thermodesulfomicrobium sp. WS TaxID=3004129 RepID=UPI0024917211|nr:hypothetical protein [Thermodesulfomicrobium sp. WS]BDV01650.1 hypothetical protein TDMWS_17350 [Thermodesulfomicrobium sp. WS]
MPQKPPTLPAIRPETHAAVREARHMVSQALKSAIRTNLAALACAGLYAYASSQRFWERKGRSWWAKARAFAKTAYLALQEDAFGADLHIETHNLDSMLEGSAPLLAIPPSPQEVDRMVTRHKSQGKWRPSPSPKRPNRP